MSENVSPSTSPPKVLLLPIPHAVPYHSWYVVSEGGEVVGHLSDTTALPFARTLKRAIEDEAYRQHSETLAESWTVKIVKGNESRVNCDLNRRRCRTRPWRQSLHNEMESASFLIDVHSFPPEHRQLQCYFIIDQEYTNVKIQCPLMRLNQFLMENGIESDVFWGIGNDIIDEAYEMDLCAILFEINEGNDYNTDRFIARKIAEWLNKN